MYLIGLTGNIACGKSTVVQMLEQLGARVCDADKVAHDVIEPGRSAYTAVVAAFGEDILVSPGGPIDRRALGRIVFTNPQALKLLEQIVHPAVHGEIEAWLARQQREGAAVAVIDAIKLIEAGWPERVNAVWVVSCRPEQQLERLVQLRGMSEEEARQRIAAQSPQEAKIAIADVVIDNSGSLDETRRQVLAAWSSIPGTPVLPPSNGAC